MVCLSLTIPTCQKNRRNDISAANFLIQHAINLVYLSPTIPTSRWNRYDEVSDTNFLTQRARNDLSVSDNFHLPEKSLRGGFFIL